MKNTPYHLLATLFIFLTPSFFFAQTPTWQWAKSAGQTGAEAGASTAIDGNGDVYATGSFTSVTLTFGTNSLVNTSASTADIFIVKYDATGNVLWAKNFGGIDGDLGNSVTVDANNNVYLTGWFTSASITFGSTTLNNSGTSSSDIFVVKFDPLGNVVWAKSAGGTSTDRGYDVTTDVAGNVFVTGWFSSPTIDFGTGILTNAGSGTNDFFIVKYDGIGNTVWSKKAGGSNSDAGYSAATDATGYIYVTGIFASSTIDFGTGALTNSSAATNDFFIVKYDVAGNSVWSNAAGGSFDDNGNSIAITGNNIFVTGAFSSSSITFASTTLTNAGAGTSDVFVVKYDASGNATWAKSAGGSDADAGNSVSSDITGNVYVTGWFSSTSIVFGTTTVTNTAVGYKDIFVTKYDVASNSIWALGVGNSAEETGNGISSDATGANIYITGMFNSATVLFGTYTIFKGCGDDVFVAKLGSTVGLSENNTTDILNVYPNPVNGILTVYITPNSPEQVEIIFFNALGQEAGKWNLLSGENKIDLSKQSTGVYFYQIRNGDKSLSGKLIVQ